MKDSLIAGIGSGAGAGILYNLATSRPPTYVAFGTYATVLFGYWGYCRYTYRQSAMNMRKMQHAMNQYHMLQGTELAKEMDTEWAQKATEKRTNVRDFREDANTGQDSPG